MKYLTFILFQNIPGLIHGISTREYGNCKPEKLTGEFGLSLSGGTRGFLIDIKAQENKTVFAGQVHGNDVASVDKDCYEKWIPGADGLVTSQQDLYLGIHTADCVPIFFVDPKNKVVGLAHAGWRGTLGEIAKKVIERMVEKHGAVIGNIKAEIGPSICKNCYEVDLKRYQLFVNHFGKDDAISLKNRRFFLDLKGINVKILLQAGIKPENIEISQYCTSCNNDLFFSYRKNKKENYGEMLSVIGFK